MGEGALAEPGVPVIDLLAFGLTPTGSSKPESADGTYLTRTGRNPGNSGIDLLPQLMQEIWSM